MACSHDLRVLYSEAVMKAEVPCIQAQATRAAVLDGRYEGCTPWRIPMLYYHYSSKQ